MGQCWGTDKKYESSSSGDQPATPGPATKHSTTSATHNSGRTAPWKAKKKRKGRAPGSSVVDSDSGIRAPKPNRTNNQPLVLPTDPDFHCSINGGNGWDVDDVYELEEELGNGTFGVVFRATHKLSHKRSNQRASWHTVAIKKTAPTVLDRRGGVRIWTYSQVEDHCQEVKTLLRLQEGPLATPCILHLYEFFWTYNRETGQGDLYLVTELLGQDLEQWRQAQQVTTERSVKQIAKVLLKAINYMASKGVVHRDIKLNNIMFRVDGDYRTLKIVDFGLAKVLVENETAKDFCGSLGYIAPEIYLSKPYRYEVDMFAFGIILFRLLSGQRPFPFTNAEKLRTDTINLSYSVKGQNWEGITADGLKLVRALLIGQEQRLTAVQAMNHRWFVAMEESVLNVDYMGTLNHVHEASENSRVVALSHAPTEPQPHRDGNVFWLDAAVEPALNILQAEGKYVGRILDDSKVENAYLIYVKEFTPTNAYVLPSYIARLNRYTEKECRRICREIAEIIKLSHDSGMAHRNLLLTNVLVDRTGHLLVRGLQYAQAIKKDEPLTGHFGYLYSWYAFKAPEIDRDFFHDKRVDLWSLGALMYMLLTGLPPFRGDGEDLIANKHAGNVVFDTFKPSRPAQKLVEGLLQTDPRNRLSIEQVLHSEWMFEADDILDRYDLSLAQAIMIDF